MLTKYGFSLLPSMKKNELEKKLKQIEEVLEEARKKLEMLLKSVKKWITERPYTNSALLSFLEISECRNTYAGRYDVWVWEMLRSSLKPPSQVKSKQSHVKENRNCRRA